jgi:tetratricopeptide (TPR) repeat protein
MPAGNLDRDYTKRFDELNLRGLYEEGLGEPLIRIFKKKFVESKLYDFVLIDSRTGFSDEAGICTRDLADSLVILSGLNRQNIEGTSRFLSALRGETKGNATFEIILSPVPNGEDDLMYEREEIAQKSFSAAWGEEINLSLQIPYHPRLALTEEPHILRQKRGALSDAYRAIERQILATLKLDMKSIVPLLLEALREEDYSTVLNKLKMLVRLDGKEQSLDKVLNSLLINPKIKNKNNEQKELPHLAQVLKHEIGKKVFAFLMEHIVYEAGDFTQLELLYHLENIDTDLVDTLYQRHLSANPSDADLCSNYAIFLEHQRGDMVQAKTHYQRAIEADRTEPRHLGNYGQFLIGQGQLPEGEAMLRACITTPQPTRIELYAETCFALHIATRLQGTISPQWLKGFKFYLQKGFTRNTWSFDLMLKQAKKILPPEEFRYAQALAAAFLDAAKVKELDKFKQWRTLEPEPIKS